MREEQMESDDWRDYRKQQQNRRSERLKIMTEELLELRDHGFDIRRLTPFHYRVNGRLDIWPIHNRWHDIKTFERGGFSQIGYFVNHYFEAHGKF